MEYWLNECDTHSLTLLAADFLTLLLLCLLITLLLVTCKQVQPRALPDDVAPPAKSALHIAHYRRPEIPGMMTDPELRAAYFVNHYWDGYSTADTAYIHSDETEQLYADFIDALQYVDTATVRTALQKMMQRMETDSTAYARFCGLGEKYLYDPNSPMRNEDYYIFVLEQMMVSQRLTEYEKIRPADRLKQAHKNRPGMTAADFGYVTPKGKAGRLSGIKADYTLLFFYNPDCANCRELERVLSEMPFFLDIQQKGMLRVLAIYADDDEDEWLLKSAQMPEGWIVGWNRQGDIRNRTLYEIRATPTLYLLDRHKRVILKDAPLEQIIRHLSMNL